MIFRKLSLIAICLYVCAGCNNEPESTAINIAVDVEKAQAIDLAKDDRTKNRAFTLENTDNSLIGMIHDIITFDSLFVVQTRGILIKFDYTGKFCGNISAKGQAGNEYIGLSAIWHRGDILYVYDMNGKKVLLYNLDSRLINTIKLSPEAASNPFQMLIPFNDGYIGKMVYKGDFEVTHELAYYDNQCAFQQIIGDAQLTSGLSLGNPFSKYDQTVLYWRQLGNFIYSIDESLTVTEKYYVDFGKKNVPLKNNEFKDEYSILEYLATVPDRHATALSEVKEYDQYVVFCFLSNTKKYLSIYDKAAKSAKTFYFTDDSRVIDIRTVPEQQIMIFSSGEEDNARVYTVNITELIND